MFGPVCNVLPCGHFNVGTAHSTYTYHTAKISTEIIANSNDLGHPAMSSKLRVLQHGISAIVGTTQHPEHLFVGTYVETKSIENML